MALGLQAYLLHLQALLPPGKAWTRAPGAWLTRLLGALAAEYSRVDARLDSLMTEADPRTTTELLVEWEAAAGLPDPCVVLDYLTIEQRQVALAAKITMRGGQSRQYFIDLAASMGYPGSTIDEYRPMTCNDTCNDALWSEDDIFTWQINLPSSGGITIANCTSDCNSPLQSWGDESIECRINRYKPAHTTVIFAYPEVI